MKISDFIFFVVTKTIAQRFESCKIESVIPEDVERKFDIDTSFYKKITFAFDLPVIASDTVGDLALIKACNIIWFMLSDRKDTRQRIKN